MAAIVKEFKPNKKYVFLKSRFIKDVGIGEFKDSRTWVEECDGKIITDYLNNEVGIIPNKHGLMGYYKAHCNWCKVVK